MTPARRLERIRHLALFATGMIRDPDFGTCPDLCEGVAAPAHMAPLALVSWQDHLLVAFHGSCNSSRKVGSGSQSRLRPAFCLLMRPARWAVRPGWRIGTDGALFVSGDKAGYIYRVIGRVAAVGG